jgi:hypothetical protein
VAKITITVTDREKEIIKEYATLMDRKAANLALHALRYYMRKNKKEREDGTPVLPPVGI